MSAETEKRREPRVRAVYLVSYTAVGDGAEVSVGRTLDISPGGVCFESARRLRPGLKVEVEIALGGKLISAGGTVVHGRQGEEGVYIAGVELEDLSEEDREAIRGRLG